MAMTDKQVKLVVAAKSGDVKSFEELFTIYHDKVYALARMIVLNSGDAEDILQDTFITAWRKLETLEAPMAFSVWIQIIARNNCYMLLRKKSMAILLDAEQDIEGFDVEDFDEPLPAVYAERADLRARLGTIIEGLSDVQRQAIVLYYFNELSVGEIADVMECSENTVKTRLFLARKAIRSEIEEQERKSNQRFYGIAGVATLPFGQVIQSHIKTHFINQGAVDASLSAIKSMIAEAEVGSSAMLVSTAAEPQTATVAASPATTAAASQAAAPAADQAASQAAAQAATKAPKAKMSALAKAATGISAVAAVGLVATIAIMLATNGTSQPDQPNGNTTAPGVSTAVPNDAPDIPITQDYDDLPAAVAGLPSEAALDYIWDTLDGYWVSGDLFVGFANQGEGLQLDYGIYQTSYWLSGSVTSAVAYDEHTVVLTLSVAATPATALDEARPGQTVIIHIDFSHHRLDNRINIKAEDLGDGEWHTYEYAGKALGDGFATTGNQTTTFLARVRSDDNQDDPNGWVVLVDDYLFIARDDTNSIGKYGIDTSDGLDYYLFNETGDWVRYVVTADCALTIIPGYPDDIANTQDVGIWDFRFHLLAGEIWAEVTVSADGEVVRIVQVYYP